MIKKWLLAATMAAGMATGASAATYTFNFYGGGGNLGSSAAFSDTTGTYTLDAYAVNTEDTGAVLTQSPLGLGVYSGGFDSGEIDNTRDDEAIVFDLSQLFFPERARLSLVSDFLSSDAYQVWGSNNAGVLSCNNSGGLSCLTDISDVIATGSGGSTGLAGIVNLDLSGTGPYQYLIATVPGGSGDDYLFKQLKVSAVPLPAAGWLLLAGMGGLAALRRKKPA